MKDITPGRLYQTIGRWINRPEIVACLWAMTAALVLATFFLSARFLIDGWLIASALLVMAAAGWTGYRYGRLHQVRRELEASQASAVAELAVARQNAAISLESLNQIQAGIFTVDRELTLRYWNQPCAEWFQISSEQVVGSALGDAFGSPLGVDLHALCTDALEQQTSQSRLLAWPHSDSDRLLACKAYPAAAGVTVMAEAVVEAGQGRTDPRDSDDYYRAIFEAAFDAILIFDPETTRIELVNARMCELWNRDRETLMQTPALELIASDAPFLLQSLQRRVKNAQDQGFHVFEWMIKDANDQPYWVEIHFRTVLIGGKTMMMSVIRDVSDRKRTAGELHNLSTKLHVVSRAARNITALMDIPELASLITDSLREATLCYSANVFIASDGAYRWAGGDGGNLKDMTPLEILIQPGEGLIGTCALEGKPILVPNVTVDDRYILWEIFPETRSELVVPVKLGDQVVAVVDLQSLEVEGFDKSDLDVANVLADQMAVALENIHLFEDTRLRAHEMEMLVQMTTDLRAALTRAEVIPMVLNSLMKLFRAESALITLKDPLSGEQVVEASRGTWLAFSGRRFPAGKGIFGQVASTGISVLNNDLPNTKLEESTRLTSGLQSLGCVPLIAQEHTIGTLAIGRTQAITANELHILETIADIVAGSIQRANLFEQTEKRLRQVQSLRTIDMAITADMSLRVTLHIILDQVMVQLRVDAADILLYKSETQRLEYTAGLGFRSRAVPRQSYKMGEDMAGKVAQERRTISVMNFLTPNAEFARSDFLAEEGIQAYFGLPMVAKGQLMGVLEIFHRSPLDPEYEWLQLMDALSVQAAIAINNTALFESLQTRNQELVQAYDTTLEGWARALELRDRETEGHSRRVTTMTMNLARQMGLSEEQLVHVRRGALLHDIGKMGIPDGILFKPGLLDENEWEIMRQHPVHAYQLLAPIDYLQPALEIPYSHHERWDGTGYPLGLKGEEIPLSARIFSVVDIWDALISDRPYQAAWEEQKIRDYIQELSGKQLDPKVVKAFFEMLDQMDKQKEK